MALAKCRECGAEVSDAAKTCPKCGIDKPIKKMSLLTKLLLGLIGLGVISQFMAGGSSKPPASSSASEKTSNTPTAAATQAATDPVAVQVGSQWNYSHVPDAMSKGTTHHAIVISSNTVEFKFPYSGEQHGRLNLRIDPKYGKDVIFSIEKGQILCHSYEDCSVLVRFDEEPAMKFSGVGSADNSTESVFIRNYDKFTSKLAKAKIVRISTNIYQEGAPVFEFDVRGFDHQKYKQASGS
jgi:hypothetical protein